MRHALLLVKEKFQPLPLRSREFQMPANKRQKITYGCALLVTTEDISIQMDWIGPPEVDLLCCCRFFLSLFENINHHFGFFMPLVVGIKVVRLLLQCLVVIKTLAPHGTRTRQTAPAVWWRRAFPPGRQSEGRVRVPHSATVLIIRRRRCNSTSH